ncbi:HprK-related kinase A [Paucibacter sp. XJ19-41]|uniref:HprK-related kinase A n=1 Tax=Paucibacter sp. XJ19-41 TaxID=2927824 RepID=UPI00234A884A|nr:HprK-related kinase A [Paucibacter sp. XJ19-41]MDC6167832.1 HprK-related kinase A [Paucibacter sp. XJ19-41]
MLIDQLTPRALQQALAGPGLRLATGPFNCSLRSDIPGLAPVLHRLYARHPLVSDGTFVDFHVKVASGRGLRRWIRPQAWFSVDEVTPFTPLPQAQALPMIEWGMNWCITAYSHHLLVLHAASVAKNGRALILPAPPGSGKSTLCAALVNRGWRLLSDELTLIRLDTGQLQALARPVNLKNQSIDVIRSFAPEAFLSAPVHDTTKGTVALMAPPADSVTEAAEPARPCWMVLPSYRAGAATALTPMASGAAFMQLADNAMNYHILGAAGFQAVGALVDRCRHYRFEYSDLNEAIATFDALAATGS